MTRNGCVCFSLNLFIYVSHMIFGHDILVLNFLYISGDVHVKRQHLYSWQSIEWVQVLTSYICILLMCNVELKFFM